MHDPAGEREPVVERERPVEALVARQRHRHPRPAAPRPTARARRAGRRTAPTRARRRRASRTRGGRAVVSAVSAVNGFNRPRLVSSSSGGPASAGTASAATSMRAQSSPAARSSTSASTSTASSDDRHQERVEQQREVALRVRVERGEHALAQHRGRHRLLGVAVHPPQRREVREVVVGVDQLPAERQRGDPVEAPGARAGRRAVGEAELAQQRGRLRVEAAAGRAEAGRPAERLGRALQPPALVRDAVPRLVAPAVAGDLVARGAQRVELVLVDLAVEPLDEERRAHVHALEQVDQHAAGTRGR